MKTTSQYDFIIAGMGCAGLSFAVQLSRSNTNFNKVLVLDHEPKTKNDRTWCFWSHEKNSWYNPIISKRWDKFRFRASDFESVLHIIPFSYCLIRGIDFYTYCLTELSKDSRFEITYDEALQIKTNSDSAQLICKSNVYEAPLIFNSIFKHQSVKMGHINYVQHFKGWLVEADSACFDESCPVFMDFDTDQENDFRFFYVIPYSKTKALVEYTGFSAQALHDKEYESKLNEYLTCRYKDRSFSILEKETGQIPMAESEFVNPYGPRVINIGTAGGHSKPSTGYTFYFIQKYTRDLVSQLEKKKFPLTETKRKTRFLNYDKILLDVLFRKRISGAGVFSRLFKKNNIVSLLKFLNEESHLSEELIIMQSVNKREFIYSTFRKFFRINV